MTTPTIGRTGRARRARFVEDLLSYMTIDEKIGQLRVARLTANSRRSDGSFEADILTLLRSGQVAAISGVETRAEAIELQTIAVEQSRFGVPLLFTSKDSLASEPLWPQPLAMAASWDAAAVAGIARAVARKAIGSGWNLVATPPIRLLSDAMRDPEASLGSSVHLAERIACSLLDGLQGKDPSSIQNVLALLCYGPLAPGGPERGAERRAGKRLIRTILRKSDLAAIEEIPPDGGDRDTAAASDIHASFSGIDLGAWRRLARLDAIQTDETDETDRREIASGLDQGYLSLNTIDEAVRRVLAAKTDLGLFRDPFYKLRSVAETRSAADLADRAALDDLARKAMVLLRNEGEILPLAPDSGRVLVVGTRSGATTNLRAALDRFGIDHAALAGLALRDDDSENNDSENEEGVAAAPIAADGLAIGMACDAATRSRVVVLVATDADCEAVAGRPVLRPGAAFEALLSALVNANRRLLLVETTRLPLDLGALAAKVPARLLAWSDFAACESALGEVLSGRANPSGRLPFALEASVPEGSMPFGHGLGYSRVGYGELAVEFSGERLTAQTTLRNPGEHDCIETVLLYLRSPAAAGLADAELRCFQRVALAAGESQRVEFELGLEELGEIGADGRVIVEPGTYEILLGRDAGHLSGCEIELPMTMIRAIAGFSRSARLRSIAG